MYILDETQYYILTDEDRVKFYMDEINRLRDFRAFLAEKMAEINKTKWAEPDADKNLYTLSAKAARAKNKISIYLGKIKLLDE